MADIPRVGRACPYAPKQLHVANGPRRSPFRVADLHLSGNVAWCRPSRPQAKSLARQPLFSAPLAVPPPRPGPASFPGWRSAVFPTRVSQPERTPNHQASSERITSWSNMHNRSASLFVGNAAGAIENTQCFRRSRRETRPTHSGQELEALSLAGEVQKFTMIVQSELRYFSKLYVETRSLAPPEQHISAVAAMFASGTLRLWLNWWGYWSSWCKSMNIAAASPQLGQLADYLLELRQGVRMDRGNRRRSSAANAVKALDFVARLAQIQTLSTLLVHQPWRLTDA